MVAAAIGIGSAVAGVAGSMLSSGAASDAASTQAAAADRSAQAAREQYAQTRSDLAPYRDFGSNALGLLSGIFGTQTAPTGPSTTTTTTGNPLMTAGGLPSGYSVIPSQATAGEGGNNGGYWLIDQSGNVVKTAQTPGELYGAFSGGGGTSTTTTSPGSPGGYGGPGSNIFTANGMSGLTFHPAQQTFQPTQAELEATPGYQFIKNEGNQAVANANAAKGRGISGEALKGAVKFSEGLAGTTLDQQQRIFQQNLANQQGIFQQNYSNIINPLEWSANLGQTAATQTGQQGLQATQNANALTVGGANATASGIVGSANATASGLNSLAGGATNYALYNNLLNGNGSGGAGSGVGGSGYY